MSMTTARLSGRLANLVVDALAGSELSADVAAGVKVLPVELTTDYLDPALGDSQVRLHRLVDAVEETAVVESIDDEASTVTLTATLTNAFTAGDPVWVEPLVNEAEAWVYLDDVGVDPTPCDVDLAVLLTLEGGPRSPEEMETVEVEWTGSEYVVVNVKGESPVLAETALPPSVVPVGDGLVPPTPPSAPSIIRAVGANVVDMRAYVTTDDHLAFLPEYSIDGGTTWAEIGQTGALYPHDGLDYDLAYTYRYRVEDREGLVSDYSLMTAPTVPRKAGEDGINDIQAGSVGADLLASTIALISLITSGTSGQRWEADSNGIRLYDETGQVIASLPTDSGSRPFFRAVLEALGLDVTGAATLRGATAIGPGGILNVEGSVGDPVNAPTLTMGLDEVLHVPAFAGFGTGVAGLTYDPAGNAGAGTYWLVRHDDTLQEINAQTGASIRSIAGWTAADDIISHFAVAVTGPTVWVLASSNKSGANGLHVYGFDKATLLVRSDVFLSPASGYVAESWTLASDGARYLFVIGHRGISGPALTYRTWRHDSGVGGSGPLVADGNGSRDLAAVTEVGLYSAEVDAGKLWLTTKDVAATVRVWNISAWPNPTRAADDDFECGSDAIAPKLTHNGANFIHSRLLDEGGGSYGLSVRKHTGWTWVAADSSKYWVGFTWYNDVAPAGVGAEDHESRIGPRSFVTMKKRQRLLVTVPSFPTGVSGVRLYMDRGSAEPAVLDLQTVGGTTIQPTTQTKLETWAGGGAAPPAVNDFPVVAVPAEVRFGTGRIMGTGQLRLQNVAVDPAAALGGGELAWRSDAGRLRWWNDIRARWESPIVAMDATEAFVDGLSTISAANADGVTWRLGVAPTGPKVWVMAPISGRLMVTVAARMTVGGASGHVAVAYNVLHVTGNGSDVADTEGEVKAPNINDAGFVLLQSTVDEITSSRVSFATGLTPGRWYRLHAYFRGGGGVSCSYRDRHIAVVPL